MPKQKTSQDYQELAEKRGFTWLGLSEYNTRDSIWQCKNKHTWQARYYSIRKGGGCPICPRTKPQDYHALAKKRGFIWVGPKVNTVDTRTRWKCQNGHIWAARYKCIQKGGGCSKCSGKFPKTPQDYHELAKKRGFTWVGSQVKNIHTKTHWQCSKGHIWETRYSGIYQGRGCPKCSRKSSKTPQDYHALAEKRGFTWVGEEVNNVVTKTRWQCKNGHTWDARYNCIQKGIGCSKCSGMFPKKPQDYHALAQKRGFTWIGSLVKNVSIKTSWQCSKGHIWESRYNSIQQGSGCPTCYRNRITKNY